MYASVAAGIVLYLLSGRLWIGIVSFFVARCLWYGVEFFLGRIRVRSAFKKHAASFKQQFGPYGIRIANKAEESWKIKESLAEVFTEDMKKLKKAVEQLEVMDTLFKAGMRPEGDEFLLHDLKLRYGKGRLSRLGSAES